MARATTAATPRPTRRSTRRAWSTSPGNHKPSFAVVSQIYHSDACRSPRSAAASARPLPPAAGHRAHGRPREVDAAVTYQLACRLGVVHHRTLRRTPLYDRHAAAGAKLVPFAGWEMPVQYAGIREEHLAVRTRRRGVRRLAHGPGRDPRPARRSSSSSGCSPTTCAGCPRAARSTACCAARTAACSTTCSPTGWRSATFLTVTNAANHEKDLAWLQSHADEFDVDVLDRARRLRDAGRPGPAGARAGARARPTASLPARLHCCQRTVAGAPMLVCGTGYTGEDGVELLLDPTTRRRSGTRSSRAGATPGRAGRARHAAPRGLLSPVRQRPERGPRADRGGPRAGAARRTTGFIGVRGDRGRAPRRAPRRSSSRS